MPYLLLPVLLSGCNNYEVFALAGYEQADFSNKADVIFVVDDSNSMWEESGAMALNIDSFIGYLTDPNSGGFGTDSLSNAVDNYVTFTTRRGAEVDFHMAITTTSVDTKAGPNPTLDPGEAGTFLGEPPIIPSDSPTASTDFRQSLLCEATCWASNQLDDDNAYVCGEPTDVVTTNYLNCPQNCDVGGWDYEHCGSGTEEPLEAALLALCRSVPSPPDVCFDKKDFTEADILSNGEFIRPDSTTVIVIVTDEGDSSRRIDLGVPDPSVYLDAFNQFENRVKFAVIGPQYRDTKLVCNSGGAVDWGIERLQTVVDATSGFYDAISVLAPDAKDANDCVPSDFAENLTDLGELLNSLLTSFKLRSIPDESTIRAFVDGKEVDKAELQSGTAGAIDAVYGTGWSYDPSENAVAFWGDAVPGYNEDVRIIYLPLEGTPREFPF